METKKLRLFVLPVFLSLVFGLLAEHNLVYAHNWTPNSSDDIFNNNTSGKVIIGNRESSVGIPGFQVLVQCLGKSFILHRRHRA